ncbi:MAG: regulatory protein RecX [Balneolaceae bacterium]
MKKSRKLSKQSNIDTDKDSSDNTSDILSDLPLIITEIQIQKKNQNRYSLFNNKRFLLGVSSKTLLDFSLQKGVNLTPLLFNQITKAENYFSAKECAIRYIGRRDHASFELKQKLLNKGFDQSTVDILISNLHEKGLLNDKCFAEKYALDKAQLNRWGSRKIESTLFKKGISKQIIQNVLKKTFDNLPQDQICVDLIVKRKKHFLRENDPYRRKKKIYAYLAGRGFPGEDINKALSRVEKQLDV